VSEAKLKDIDRRQHISAGQPLANYAWQIVDARQETSEVSAGPKH
jgi:hypothetical protein